MPEVRQESLELQSSINDKEEVSLYSGPLTPEILLQQIVKAKVAFPMLTDQYFDLLRERLTANGFSNSRLRDAVNYVIDNFKWSSPPAIANFISYDKTFKVYNYYEMMKKFNECGQEIWNSYKPIKFRNKPKKVWVHVNDIETFGLEDEE